MVNTMERLQTLVGVSRAMREIQQDLDGAIKTDARVLITGEPGVGKHAVARLIHEASGRSRGPLERCDCSAIPDALMEAELFGPQRVTIEGDPAGRLTRAQGGTIFLNEVGEMSLRAQLRLLWFLEYGAAAGAQRPAAAADVRLIAASSRSLAAQMAGGTFREDLFYRLNVIHLAIPPLRERREDIPVLFDHFARLYTEEHGRRVPQVRADVLARLTGYDWPGNVHELKRLTEQLVGASSGSISMDDLPAGLAM
jgi:two-component system nitrogen regulation response regulator NtrX